MFYLKKLSSADNLRTYQEMYSLCSGFEMDIEYLKSAKVFGLFLNGKLSAGYVLNDITKDSRTISCFASIENRANIFDKYIGQNKTTEICCFWISKRIPDYKLSSIKVWLDMALRVTVCSKNNLLFGTNSKGLARMYSYPENSFLIHEDKVNDSSTWIFRGYRSQFMAGLIKIIFKKLQFKINKQWNNFQPQLIVA